jgi:hypothetical protein
MIDASAKTSYKSDIRPLFRDQDINAMKRKFDLSKYQDVYDNADKIFKRLRDGDMPCDGPWQKKDVELFGKWIDDGKLP